MFTGRWVYTKGCTVADLVTDESTQKPIMNETDGMTASCGCVLFLKSDVVGAMESDGPQSGKEYDEQDLLFSVVSWARGAGNTHNEYLTTNGAEAPSHFPITSLGPWTVIEQCAGDPCSFGVVAGFVLRRPAGGDSDVVLWEWGELASCSTLSQLSLYLDNPTSMGGKCLT
ncbi:hypothetical protein, conserved [Trypanosoma brucei gambiense DAL972]|uniref:Uncharacterized protein n=2 Tax=Trypanosoma brucei TaxID=5691 RepID=C9ZN15_TRYB9|nr:hypothetical protein, conserved [Trypanosoma brucei gambiense DAL972]RHW73238.1 hypothetical protein DPX39_040040700 [Trypanosoma brucei equiperdum]CBH10669.1 hypothetical protein, conserved [Trypanosoma brucei gambiense DAL972]|eukprot:XP_011772957.1 hypothetical protein, conserved [Trypanosoma brucei gambiense DAL972]